MKRTLLWTGGLVAATLASTALGYHTGYTRATAARTPVIVHPVEQMMYGGQDIVSITSDAMRGRGFDPDNLAAKVYFADSTSALVPVLRSQKGSLHRPLISNTRYQP